MSGGFIALVDDEDFDRVSARHWHRAKDHNTHYAVSWTAGKKAQTKMHRFILGVTDPKIPVDHIDGNGLNNCRSNIHIVTVSFNLHQRKKAKLTTRGTIPTSQFKGVSWNAYMRKWKVTIRFERVRHHGGYHSSEIEAAQKYNSMIVGLMGQDKSAIGRVLNVIPQLENVLEENH